MNIGNIVVAYSRKSKEITVYEVEKGSKPLDAEIVRITKY